MTDYTISAVDEALAILLLVSQHPGLGVTEIANRSGNTKARSFRLLYTLEQRGFVQREGNPPTYLLGHRALYLGVAAQDQVGLVRLARDRLREIGRQCNENVQIKVRDGLETICIARWESTQALRVHSDAANRRPLHVGASGKMLLAHAPDEVREAVLGGNLPRYTQSTIVQRSKLIQEISRIREKGYSVSIGEGALGAVAVAAPVRDITGDVLATLSIAGPEVRLTGEQLQFAIDLVVKEAKALSASLGFVPTAAS